MSLLHVLHASVYAVRSEPIVQTHVAHLQAVFSVLNHVWQATLDVWYLTQWVSIYQFTVSFIYMPFLALPGFAGNDHAIPVCMLQ